MKKKIILLLIVLFPSTVFAGSASLGFSGSGSVQNGNEIKLNININSTSSAVVSFGGVLSYDSSYLDFNGCSASSPFTLSNNGTHIALVDYGTNGKQSGSIGTCIFKAKREGNTSVTIKSLDVTSANEDLSASFSAKSITITPPPSGNNNLRNLSVNPGGINFSANNTNYTVNVDANVTSVNISAQAEDGKAQVSGTGTKQLNYGNNKISVNVKAENGATKNYIINVNRKDDRSGDANLKSLNVSNGKLSPGFSSNELTYSMEVPYNVSKLNIDAKASDSKSKVSISNNDLVPEKTTKVEIKVTAENGNTRTYTISVKRGKDPNKVLSTNNNLSSISVDQGVLSPAFNKDQLNYIVYIPYETNSINISYEVEDKEYAVVKMDGPTSLGVGENVYKLSVTAEDESVKTYNVIVNRGKNLTGDVSSNTYLREIKIENGSLTSRFNRDVHLYRYTAKKDFKIEAFAEVDDANVEIVQSGNIYVIIVTAPNGDKSIYILMPKEVNVPLLIGILMFVIAIAGVIVYFIANKRNKKHAK